MVKGTWNLVQSEPAATVYVTDLVYGESLRSSTKLVSPRPPGAAMARIQKVTATTSFCRAASVEKQRGRMSHALAVAATAPVVTWRARVKGIPLTGTMECVKAPSNWLKQSSGSPETSGEGSANAAAAPSKKVRSARASIRLLW